MSEVDEERFVRLKDGTIYGYSPLLAKRRDAVIVDGYAAAQWFNDQGISNELTEKYPNTPPQFRAKERAEAQTTARTHINQAAIAAKAETETKRVEQREKLQKLKLRMKASDDEGSDVEDSG